MKKKIYLVRKEKNFQNNNKKTNLKSADNYPPGKRFGHCKPVTCFLKKKKKETRNSLPLHVSAKFVRVRLCAFFSASAKKRRKY